MDEIIMRRLRHLQRLEEQHEADFLARCGPPKTEAEKRQEHLADALAADWNRKQRAARQPQAEKPLPKGWRKEHWKTQQAMAADYAGVKAANKYEAVQALAAYEAKAGDLAAA